MPGTGSPEEPGNLTATGEIGAWGGLFMGTTSGSPALSAVHLAYHATGGLAGTSTIDLTEPDGSFLWRDNAAVSPRAKMSLSGGNVLRSSESMGRIQISC